MAFTVFLKTGKACMFFTWNSVKVSVCAYFDHAAPLAADYQNLADDFGNGWSSNLRALQTQDITLGDCVVYDLSSLGAPKYTFTGVNGLLGTVLQDSAPNNTAAVISHRTDATGRSSRGRTYYPGLTEDNIGDGVLGAPSAANILSEWGDLLTFVALNAWTLVVAQRFSNGIQLTTGVTRVVTSEVLSLTLGTQRRRQAIG